MKGFIRSLLSFDFLDHHARPALVAGTLATNHAPELVWHVKPSCPPLLPPHFDERSQAWAVRCRDADGAANRMPEDPH